VLSFWLPVSRSALVERNLHVALPEAIRQVGQVNGERMQAGGKGMKWNVGGYAFLFGLGVGKVKPL
jgi:hypothetical protein